MSKISIDVHLPSLPAEVDPGGLFVKALSKHLQDMAAQINMVSEEKVAAHYSAQTAQPSGVILAQGDFVRKSNPSEEGTVGSKYVTLGWVTITDGTASATTTLEARVLTGS